MRLISAIFNPIDDCDEVFNFYEPVSFKKQTNKQTKYYWRRNKNLVILVT